MGLEGLRFGVWGSGSRAHGRGIGLAPRVFLTGVVWGFMLF